MHLMLQSSIEFIKCILEQNDFLKNRYLLASSKKPKAIVNFDSDSDKWFLDKQIYLRKVLRNFKIVKKGEYYELKDLLLPIFNEKYNDNFYKIVSNLNMRNKILSESEEY